MLVGRPTGRQGLDARGIEGDMAFMAYDRRSRYSIEAGGMSGGLCPKCPYVPESLN